METNAESSEAAKRIGGRVALDFVNTVDLHTPDRPGEVFGTYDDLLGWCREGGSTTGSRAKALAELAASTRLEADDAVERARTLREAIYRAVLAATSDEPPPAADLAILNRELASAMSAAWIAPTDSGVSWTWDRPGTDALESILWPVVRDAADLLTSRDSGRVRQCAGEDCDWLFLDTSRNRSRRWCSMEDCGNRAKAKRHYARQRTRAV